MDIATSGVADDARISDEEDLRTSPTPPPAPVNSSPLLDAPTAAALVWLAEEEPEPSETAASASDPERTAEIDLMELTASAVEAPVSIPSQAIGSVELAGKSESELSAPENFRVGISEEFVRGAAAIIDRESPHLEPSAERAAGASHARFEAIARRLEEVAQRIRAGDLRPESRNDEPSDAAALAAALASLLDRTR